MPLFNDAMTRANAVWGALFPGNRAISPYSPYNQMSGGMRGANPFGNPFGQGMREVSPFTAFAQQGLFGSYADRRSTELARATAPAPAFPRATSSSGYAVPADFYPALAKAASTHNVDAALLRAIMEAESGGDPRALSAKGAIGLMQLMPETARGLGVDPWDPAANLMGGAAYLADLLAQAEGDIPRAVGMYNAGPAGDLTNPETAAFIPRVMGLYQSYRGWQPEGAAYGPTANQMPVQQGSLTLKAQEIMQKRLPYVFGGGRGMLGGLDCSSFVSRVYREALGQNLVPHTDTSFTQTVAANGPPQVGDIVYFEYADPSQPGTRFPHMGMVYTVMGGKVNVIHHTTYGGSNTTRVDDLETLSRALGARVYSRRLPT